jgi:hypothetical protein
MQAGTLRAEGEREGDREALLARCLSLVGPAAAYGTAGQGDPNLSLYRMAFEARAQPRLTYDSGADGRPRSFVCSGCGTHLTLADRVVGAGVRSSR